MSAIERRITRSDIIPHAQYAAERDQRRAAIIKLKRDRRLFVGPFATLYFENYDTMLHQVLEMLHTEKGGDEQVADELEAYNPLVPQGRELCATFMIEIADERTRAATLATLGGIDDRIMLEVNGERVAALPEHDVERTKEDGKTSSVHFVRFPLTDSQAAAFKTPGAQIIFGVEHPLYGHLAVAPEAVRAALAADLA